MTLAAAQTHLDAVDVAIGDEDWVTARRRALQALAQLSGSPDAQSRDHEIRMRDDIKTLLTEITSSQSAAGGIQTSKAIYRPVTNP